LSTRTLTLPRLAARQMRARWPSYVPTAIGVAAALALGVAVTLTQARTDEASLVQAMSGLGPSGLVMVRLTGVRQADAYTQFQRDVIVAVGHEHGLVTPRSTFLYSGAYTPLTINGAPVGSFGVDYARSVVPLQIAVLEDLRSHVALVSGAWPSSPVTGATLEVTLPEAAAAGAHLKLGDTQCQKVREGTYVACFHVAAIWRPLHPDEAFWAGQSPPLAAFTDDASYFATIKAEADKDPQPQLVSVAIVTLAPDASAIRSEGADASLVDLRRLHAEFGVARPDAAVISNLETALDAYVAERDLAAFAVQLVAAQLLLVALYCVWLLAGTLLVQQQASISVWRSRGWSWRGVTSLLYLELLGVAVIACPFGLAAGWAVSENVARLEYGATAIAAFHFDLVRIGLPIAAVLAAELAILAAQAMLAARQGILASRTESSRPAIPWWRQRYLDLALAVLAIPLLAASGFLGSAAVRASADSQNPMLLLLPGLAVALLAIASLRLLPFLAAAVARLRVSIAGRLASLQLLRAPSQHSGLAVLLVLAVALGIFATTYVATAQKNGADRAAYQVGADVRGTFSGAVTTLPDQVALRGAASRSSVFRGYAHDG
ncbi:MAG TPA: FtsX-like permease family protein, partial [Candidatus Dormibacteraeota bacterium]|nr:FtsX-like permease family protein [Candidatus Dormibacteraeota bacterium]